MITAGYFDWEFETFLFKQNATTNCKFCNILFKIQMRWKNRCTKHENQMLNFGLIDKVKGGIISESFPSIQKVCQITKGQINSKGLFGILGFFQKMNEQSRF